MCTQPISDVLTVAAFHLGLKNKLKELKEFIDEDYVIYHKGYTQTELRKLFCRRILPGFVDRDKVYERLETLLDIARIGLLERGLGEEIFLDSLYKRVKEKSNPAIHLLDELKAGHSIEDIIKEYGKL